MDEELENHINQILKIRSEADEVRNEGESYISELQENNCFELLRLSCSVILEEQEVPNVAVQLSFILINRNRIFLINKWSELTLDQQNTMRKAAMRGLFFQDQAIRSISSLTFCLVSKCGIDVFKKDIFQIIAFPICNTDYDPHCTVGCFMALKELVHQEDIIKQDFPFYDELGKVVIDAFAKIISDPKVFQFQDFLEFLSCYSSILPFFQDFYPNEESLKQFLKLIDDALHIDNDEIHAALYNLLYSIFECFYEHIDTCIDIIFGMSMNSLVMVENPEYIKPAINLWYKISEHEIELSKTIKSKISKKSIVFHDIVATKCSKAPEMVDQLMMIITQFEPDTVPQSIEIEDMESLNSDSVYQSAIDCLRMFSSLTNFIFKKLSAEFDKRIESSEWRDRLTAIYSCYCISMNDQYNINVDIVNEDENESTHTCMHELNQFYENRFDILIELTKDPVEIVRTEALSFLAIIFRVDNIIATSEEFLSKILRYLNYIFFGLKESVKKGGEEAQQISDIIPGKICDIILEIGKNNLNKYSKNIEYQEVEEHRKEKSKEDSKKEKSKEEEEEGEGEEEKDIYRILGNETPQTNYSVFFFKFLRILFNIFDFPIFQAKNYAQLQEKCTIVIETMFKSAPIEQHYYILNEYLPIIFSHIELQFQILSEPPEGADDNIDSITRIKQLCIILSAIVKVVKNGISEYSEPILQFIIKCLTMKNVPIHEQALICLKNLIHSYPLSIIDTEKSCLIPDVMETFFISQDSQNDFIVSESVKVLLSMFQEIPNSGLLFDQALLKSIFDVFMNNLKDEEISLETRLEIVKVFGNILKILKNSAQPFFEMYVEVLTNYQTIPFSFLPDDEAQEASLLYSTIINGYGDLLEACIGFPFFTTYMQNFQSIVKFIDSIGRLEKCLTKDLKKSVLNYIGITLDPDHIQAIKSSDPTPSLTYYKKIKGLIHKKFKPILNVLKSDDNLRILSQAETLYEYLMSI